MEEKSELRLKLQEHNAERVTGEPHYKHTPPILVPLAVFQLFFAGASEGTMRALLGEPR